MSKKEKDLELVEVEENAVGKEIESLSDEDLEKVGGGGYIKRTDGGFQIIKDKDKGKYIKDFYKTY